MRRQPAPADAPSCGPSNGWRTTRFTPDVSDSLRTFLKISDDLLRRRRLDRASSQLFVQHSALRHDARPPPPGPARSRRPHPGWRSRSRLAIKRSARRAQVCGQVQSLGFQSLDAHQHGWPRDFRAPYPIRLTRRKYDACISRASSPLGLGHLPIRLTRRKDDACIRPEQPGSQSARRPKSSASISPPSLPVCTGIGGTSCRIARHGSFRPWEFHPFRAASRSPTTLACTGCASKSAGKGG